MPKIKRGWHNPPKQIENTQEGECPYCKKHVKSLEGHVHDKHKGEKSPKK